MATTSRQHRSAIHFLFPSKASGSHFLPSVTPSCSVSLFSLHSTWQPDIPAPVSTSQSRRRHVCQVGEQVSCTAPQADSWQWRTVTKHITLVLSQVQFWCPLLKASIFHYFIFPLCFIFKRKYLYFLRAKVAYFTSFFTLVPLICNLIYKTQILQIRKMLHIEYRPIIGHPTLYNINTSPRQCRDKSPSCCGIFQSIHKFECKRSWEVNSFLLSALLSMWGYYWQRCLGNLEDLRSPQLLRQ